MEKSEPVINLLANIIRTDKGNEMYKNHDAPVQKLPSDSITHKKGSREGLLVFFRGSGAPNDIDSRGEQPPQQNRNPGSMFNRSMLIRLLVEPSEDVFLGAIVKIFPGPPSDLQPRLRIKPEDLTLAIFKPPCEPHLFRAPKNRLATQLCRQHVLQQKGFGNRRSGFQPLC